jgi:hypothetical protein
MREKNQQETNLNTFYQILRQALLSPPIETNNTLRFRAEWKPFYCLLPATFPVAWPVAPRSASYPLLSVTDSSAKSRV